MKQKYMFVLFPICSFKWEYIENLIEKNLFVLEKKTIELNEKMKFELIYDLYQTEDWLGDSNNNWEGVYYKMNSCFKKEMNTVKLFYVLASEKEVKQMKEKIRDICKCGKHSIHSTDYEKQANQLKIKYFK